MPVSKSIGILFLVGLFALAGCPASTSQCPEASVSPGPFEIPEGESQATLVVSVENPNPFSDLEIITELTAESGGIEDPFARETTYTCAFDASGEVEICVNAKYVDSGDAGMPDSSVPEGGVSEAGVGTASFGESSVGSSAQHLRKPHVRLTPPLECSETRCTTVICPGEKNQCPTISEFSVELTQQGGSTATVTVIAEDADQNPEPLTTTIVPDVGTVDDPGASQATYTCDPNIGGAIEICAVASDGDPACEVERCATVLCPGDPRNNTCPVIASFTANPTEVPLGQTTAQIAIDVSDPDEFPSPLRTELRSQTGVFEDRFVTETTFRCGDSGPVEMCVEAFDGDEACDQERCITVQCPSDIPANVCPMLFVLNAVPSTIQPGETSTLVQSRGQDTDFLPMPLVLTMRALWGTITNDENIQLPTNVVAQDATYTCDRPGEVEICVDATDGACEKTLCIEVDCPDDIPPP